LFVYFFANQQQVISKINPLFKQKFNITPICSRWPLSPEIGNLKGVNHLDSNKNLKENFQNLKKQGLSGRGVSGVNRSDYCRGDKPVTKYSNKRTKRVFF